MLSFRCQVLGVGFGVYGFGRVLDKILGKGIAQLRTKARCWFGLRFRVLRFAE